MTDLFISYTSHDEPWAKKFFFDIKSRFPTIKLFWARDTVAIPPGERFRPIFEGAARDATNFAVFWSAAAQKSNEVGPEIQAFLQNRDDHPTTPAGDKRKLFYIPLETGVDYGGLVEFQGFPEFRGVYNPGAVDRGIALLDQAPADQNWHRMIGAIGNEVLAGEASQPITLALFVMTSSTRDYVDPFLKLNLGGGPSLDQFLQSVGLTLDDAKARYGDTAFGWRPFGTAKTIIDLMEDAREMVGRTSPDHRFNWRPVDFVDEANKAANEPALQRLLEGLSENPSVVVTDPISLFNPLVQTVFKRLGEYAKKQQSMILSISPTEAAAAERLYGSLLSNGSPVLNAHLYPQIPATDPFAFCGVDVQHIVQVERLIRSGLGYYYLKKKRAEAKPFTSPGG